MTFYLVKPYAISTNIVIEVDLYSIYKNTKS